MSTIREKIVTYLQWVIEKLEKPRENVEAEDITVINSLAPRIITDPAELKKIEPYLRNLKAAIDNPGINNIAITGGYGSGKSTILKTFQDANNRSQGYEYLNISLASFQEETNQNILSDHNTDTQHNTVLKQAGNYTNRTDIQRKLEISILQQMFYQVDPDKIPDSRFKRIVNLKPTKLLWVSCCSILWLFSLIVLVKFDRIEQLNPNTWDISLPIDWGTLLPTLVSFCGVGLISKKVYHLSKNASINKFSIKGEIELGEKIDKSIFNQHLEEILYFFERTKYNVVVIEDVDRFESTEIFTKLRELNIVINHAQSIGRSVKFVYAIRDDKFKDNSERVKFFDFIIPIISFINPSNSNDQLAKLILNNNLSNELPSDFINDVLPFIEDIDMRLLLNIFQEYLIYKQLLSSKLDQKKLFSILIYKNLQPKDFMDLTKGKGDLFSFFSDRKKYIEHSMLELEDQLNVLSNKIDNIENETAKSIQELRSIYILRFISKLEDFLALYLDVRVTPAQALADDYFYRIKSNSDCQYFKTASYGRHELVKVKINFKDIEQEVNPIFSYEERENHIHESEVERIDALKRERLNKQKDIQYVKNMSIQEIFQKKDIAEYLHKFGNKSLMRSLLLNGYIAEDFTDYISLFHGISLTQSDHEFDRAVKSGFKSKYDHPLTNMEYLIARLPERYFSKDSIWNFALLDFLLDNENVYRSRLQLFLGSLDQDSQEHFQFIYDYIKRTPKSIGSFINGICEAKPSLWKYIVLKSGLPISEIKELFVLIVKNVPIEKIANFNDVQLFYKWIKEIPDVFEFIASENLAEPLLQLIEKRKIKIAHLDIPNSDQNSILGELYFGDFYEINSHNIRTILTALNIPFEETEFQRKQLTTLLKLEVDPLHKYLRDNLSEYVKNVLSVEELNNQESEEILIEILNSLDIDEDVKRSFLKSQVVMIEDIDFIRESDMKLLALECNRVVPNWLNVYKYTLTSEISSIENDLMLLSYLNIPYNYQALSKGKLVDIEEDGVAIEALAKGLLRSTNLSNEAYLSLLDSQFMQYGQLELENLNIEKVESLISKKILKPTMANFEALANFGSNIQVKFIEGNAAEFLGNSSSWKIDNSIRIGIFNSQLISIQLKYQYLQSLDISTIDESTELRSILVHLVLEPEIAELPEEILKALISDDGHVPNRIEILLKYHNQFDNDDIAELVSSFGNMYQNIFDSVGEIGSFEYNSSNINLFKTLKNRGLIKEFKSLKRKVITVVTNI